MDRDVHDLLRDYPAILFPFREATEAEERKLMIGCVCFIHLLIWDVLMRGEAKV